MQVATSVFFVAVLALGWGLRLFGLEPAILMHGSFIPSQMPEFDVGDIWTGQYQTQFDAHFKENFPLRSAYVKVYNQTVYQVFGQSPLKSVEIGAEKVLFEKAYLQDYFGLEDEKDDRYFLDLIRDMEYIQQELERHGKYFYLYITPSKADFYAEYAPVKYRYVKKQNGYQRNYDKLMGFLKNSKLHYFDCAAYLKEIQNSVDTPLFAKTGTHWSPTAAAIAMARFTEEFAKTYGSGILPVAKYQGAVKSLPDTERDIYLLMNTMQRFSDKDYKDVDYFAPVVDTVESGTSGYSVFSQGGSFQYEFLTALREVFHGAINRIQNIMLIYNDQCTKLNSVEEVDMKKLLQQDILLLECNQQMRLNAGFITQLKEYIEKNGIPPREVTHRVWAPKMAMDPRTYGVYSDGWTRKSAGVYLKNEAFKTSGITLNFHAHLGAVEAVAARDQGAKKLVVDIRVNGVLAQSVEFDRWDKSVHISSDQFEVSPEDTYLVELDCNTTFSPSQLPEVFGEGNLDTRKLGVRLEYIGG